MPTDALILKTAPDRCHPGSRSKDADEPYFTLIIPNVREFSASDYSQPFFNIFLPKHV